MCTYSCVVDVVSHRVVRQLRRPAPAFHTSTPNVPASFVSTSGLEVVRRRSCRTHIRRRYARCNDVQHQLLLISYARDAGMIIHATTWNGILCPHLGPGTPGCRSSRVLLIPARFDPLPASWQAFESNVFDRCVTSASPDCRLPSPRIPSKHLSHNMNNHTANYCKQATFRSESITD